MHQSQTLAWHETLELHELIAFQSNCLMGLKKAVRKVRDSDLQELYIFSIQALEKNIQELLQFLPYAPLNEAMKADRNDTGYYAGDLLGAAKTLVRNYAIAITETATPQLREVLVKQLNSAINLHAQVYYFMYERSYYPSYDLTKLLQNDKKNAHKALTMEY